MPDGPLDVEKSYHDIGLAVTPQFEVFSIDDAREAMKHSLYIRRSH